MGIATDHLMAVRHRIAEASSYEDRVASVATDVQATYGDGFPGEMKLDDAIAACARHANVSELRLGGRAWSAFVKDVRAVLKSRGFRGFRRKEPESWDDWYAAVDTKRTTDAEDREKARAKRQDMAQRLVDEIGNTFPDGDPHDALMTVARRHRMEPDAYWDLVKGEFRKLTGHKDMYAYCASIHDDLGMDGENPFR